MKKLLLIDGAIILVVFGIGVYFYHLMPESMPIHWRAHGPDRYGSRFVGVFGFPIVICIVVAVLIFVPWIDPLNANITKFRKYYDIGLVILPAVLLAIYVQMLLWALGIMVQAILPAALAVLLYFIGVLFRNSKRNWTVGLKTPWTLSSDVVWERTHRITGTLFKLSGIVVLAGVFFPAYQGYLVIVTIVVTPLYGVMYSYFLYQSEQKGEN